MRRVHQFGGIFFFLLALFVGYLSTKLTYFTSLGPGPGFFPFWLSVILAALAVVMFMTAVRSPSEPLPEDFFSSTSGYLKSATAVLALIATATFIDRFGFIVTMVAFYAVLLFVFGRRHIVEIAALVFIGSFGVYYLFTKLLGAPLPRGVYGF